MGRRLGRVSRHGNRTASFPRCPACGGAVGDPFVFNGVSYRSIAFIDDASTDLRVVEVGGNFRPGRRFIAATMKRAKRSSCLAGMLSRGGGSSRQCPEGLAVGRSRNAALGQNTVARVTNLRTGGGDHLYAGLSQPEATTNVTWLPATRAGRSLSMTAAATNSPASRTSWMGLSTPRTSVTVLTPHSSMSVDCTGTALAKAGRTLRVFGRCPAVSLRRAFRCGPNGLTRSCPHRHRNRLIHSAADAATKRSASRRLAPREAEKPLQIPGDGRSSMKARHGACILRWSEVRPCRAF